MYKWAFREDQSCQGGLGHLTKKFPLGTTRNWMIRWPFSGGPRKSRFLDKWDKENSNTAVRSPVLIWPSLWIVTIRVGENPWEAKLAILRRGCTLSPCDAHPGTLGVSDVVGPMVGSRGGWEKRKVRFLPNTTNTLEKELLMKRKENSEKCFLWNSPLIPSHLEDVMPRIRHAQKADC